ncbi:hypothetical protein BKA64DRAFT_273793 [Cadophora sp. MPI-SDFR-AT-0126]|nr:hypothetical protein BKA64DRAFT_273793 [Leotiomycetes sp. MPI-SDFR-AT-0126]
MIVILGILNYPQVWSPGVPQKKFVSLAHDAFITAITGDLLDAGIFKSAADWYLGFLESMIRDSWVDVFRPVLNNINLKTETPSEEDIAVTFKALETIVSILKEKNLALVDIVNALYKMGALKETDGDQTHATRLVFHAVGWITLLYSPDPNTKSVGLNIMSSDEAENHSKNIPSRRPGRPRSKIISKTRQSIDLVDHPLPDLLKKFGRIMPEHDRPIFSGQITPLAPCYTRPDEWLEAPMLCFYTLHMVTSIKIEWVDCLCLHLDFDSQSKILRLFRFPSLCLVMCCNRQQCCLSQLFSDAANRNGFNGPGQDDARDYFKEVLLSYRLIFGQDRSSWPYYKLLRPSLAASVNETPDPLLDIVCGQSWESEDSRQIWNEIGAEDPADRYSLTEDFEFLSKRLMTLQRYVKGHNPSGFLSLWYDRRYPLQWWNLWVSAVMEFPRSSLKLSTGSAYYRQCSLVLCPPPSKSTLY